MRHHLSTCLLCGLLAIGGTWSTAATAADLESFEFNDPAGTGLAQAANTANPGNAWVEDANMLPSDVRNGSYNLVHDSTIVESNYLQVANVTSGTVYLVARMSAWKFGVTLDPANLEEVRFGFLNDDDADFGSTITAQMTLRRNAAGDVELVGDALGAGSSNITGLATFSATRTAPLTVALELNKTSNSYKVFYKDNAGATQVLGLGAVAATRDGNSLRFATNNSFNEGNFDYPVVPADEVFSVDRIALANTNPFTDLITLEIDRDNGAMTLRNTSGAAINGVESYSITSTAGGLNPAGWSPIAGGTNTSSPTSLAQTFGSPLNFANGQATVLSTAAGAWLQSPFEDLAMTLNLTGGTTRTVNVNFIDNGGVKFANGDFNHDGAITTADYTILATNAETGLAGLSRVEAYRKGDVSGDGFNTIEDFIQFKTIYESTHGAGSFAVMLASVPEPASLTMVGLASLAIGWRRRRRATTAATTATIVNKLGITNRPRGGMSMRRGMITAMLAAWSMLLVPTAARAAILEDFTFSDPNGTTLDLAANTAHAGNNWTVAGAGTGELTNSSVLNGSFRIQKTTTNLSSNYIDIANITSGKAWLVAEVAGWNFTATASSPSEEVRFAFLDNDNTPPSGSTITAQMDIRRAGSGLSLVGIGAAGTGSSNITATHTLPLVRSTPFTMVLELDKNADQYSVYYKDNSDPFQLMGTANLGASTLNTGDRDGNSIRFAPTGSFNDTGEFFDISRIYLTDSSPIVGPVTPVTLSLEVRSNGLMFIKNETDNPVSFDSYRITSAASALDASHWTSLESQGIDSVGVGAGQHWTAAGGSSDSVLSESFLLGASTLQPGQSLSLGTSFKVGGAQDLTFQYRDTVSLALPNVVPTYVTAAAVPGDYNLDGTVNAADYSIWRDTLGSTTDLRANGDNTGASAGKIDQADYTYWKTRFGSIAGSGGASLTAVPEPTALVLVGSLLMCISAGARRRAA